MVQLAVSNCLQWMVTGEDGPRSARALTRAGTEHRHATDTARIRLHPMVALIAKEQTTNPIPVTLKLVRVSMHAHYHRKKSKIFFIFFPIYF